MECKCKATCHDGDDYAELIRCPRCVKRDALWDEETIVLRFIAKGEGAFSRDPLEHATNVIVDITLAAQQMLARRGELDDGR